MKRLLVSAVVSFYCFGAVDAQVGPAENYVLAWNDGSVFFKSGDTLHCQLRYNHAASIGVLQILENDIIVTLPPEDVNTFSFYDEKKQRTRKFSSLTIVSYGDPNQSVFMEYLYSDHRFSIVNHRTMDVPYQYMNYTRLISKPVRMSKKYILDASTGELLPLSKENALRLMDDKQSEVKNYIQSHHLKFKKTADFIHLFQYHNSL